MHLCKAGFLASIFERSRVLLEVRRNRSDLPAWRYPDTRFDGAPTLSAAAVGTGPIRVWRSDWPRRSWIMDEAREQLDASPYRDTVLAALQRLSLLSPSATPHHWAEPLTQQGVPLAELLALLEKLGLARATRGRELR